MVTTTLQLAHSHYLCLPATAEPASRWLACGWHRPKSDCNRYWASCPITIPPNNGENPVTQHWYRLNPTHNWLIQVQRVWLHLLFNIWLNLSFFVLLKDGVTVTVTHCCQQRCGSPQRCKTQSMSQLQTFCHWQSTWMQSWLWQRHGQKETQPLVDQTRSALNQPLSVRREHPVKHLRTRCNPLYATHHQNNPWLVHCPAIHPPVSSHKIHSNLAQQKCSIF